MFSRRKAGPRITERSDYFYMQQFKNLNAGTEYACEAFAVLFRKILADYKGYFDKWELALLIDVFSDVRLTPTVAGQQFKMQVKNGIKVDAMDQKWGIDKEVFLAKIDKLPIFTSCVFEVWAAGYKWTEKREGRQTVRDYIKPLLVKKVEK